MFNIYHSKISATSIQKRGGSPTFASNTEHTPAFTTVHIIAAVIGIVGAIAVFITIILLCKRKRNNGNSIQQVKTDIESNIIQSTTNTTTIVPDRFGRFASDFDNNVEPPKPAIIHVEDVSPIMQQYHLQLKLLQQQQEERKKNNNTLQVPLTHNRASSSSSSSSSNTLLPPPPYHP